MLRLVLLVVVLCLQMAYSSEYIKIPLQQYRSFYMAKMEVGTPASKVFIAMTMFPYPLTIQCAKYTDEQLYVPKESSSMSKVYCNSTQFKCENKCPLTNKKEQCYNIFGKEKTKMKVYEDVFRLSQKEETKGIFNCEDFNNQNDGKQKKQKQSTGLLGLSSLDRANPLVSWIFASERREKVMSFCFGKTGYVQLGSDPQNKPSKGLSLTYPKNKNAFIFALSKISLGSTDIFDAEQSKPINILFGSFDNYFSLVPNKIYNKLYQVVSKICEKDEDCQFAKQQKGVMTYSNIESTQQLQKKFKEQYPVLSFQINGQTMEWGPLFYFCSDKNYFTLCFRGFDTEFVLLSQKFFLFRQFTVFLEQNRLQISDLQLCSGDGESQNAMGGQSTKSQSSGKGRKDFGGSYQYKRDKNSQKDDQKKQGMRDERPRQQHPREEEAENQKQEKKEELSEQKQPKETTKGTFDSNQFKLLVLLVILFLLILIFCGGKIHRFCLGQKNKLNTTSSQLTEEVGQASEMSVK